MKTFLLSLLVVFLFSIDVLSQVPTYVPTNGLVGWWPFNGNANDISGYNHHGNVNGVTLSTDRNGNSNKAYSFDGVNDWITLPNIIPVHTGSISYWFKTIDSTDAQILVYHSSTQGNGFSTGDASIETHTGVNWSSKHVVYFKNSSSGGVEGGLSPNSLDLNTWYHIVVTYQTPVIAKIYINGSLAHTLNLATEDGNYQPLYTFIGRPFWNERFFNGTFDDFGIWNRVLTQQEIFSLYVSSQLSEEFNFLPDSLISCNSTWLTPIMNFDELVWSNGSETDSLSIIESGNYLAYGKIGNAWYVDSTDVTIIQSKINLNDTNICETSPIIISLANTPTLNQAVQWSTGANTSSININPSQTNTYSVIISEGSISCYDTVLIQVFPEIPQIFELDTLQICGNEFDFSAPSGFSNYSWSTGDSIAQLTLTTGGIYFLTVENSDGCFKKDSVFVSLQSIEIIQIDTAYCFGDAFVLEAITNANSIQGCRYIKFESTYSEDNGQVNVYEIEAFKNGMNIAWQKPGYANSFEYGSWNSHGIAAIDGDQFSRWSSDRDDLGPDSLNPHFIVIDLLDNYTGGNSLDSIRVNIQGFDHWNQTFKIYCSTDNVSWFCIATEIDTTGIFTYEIPVDQNVLWSNGSFGNITIIQLNETMKYFASINDGINTCQDSITISKGISNTSLLSNDTYYYCNSETVTLDAPLNYSSYLWSTEETTSGISISQVDTYSITVSDSINCFYFDAAIVQLPPLLSFDTSDYYIEAGILGKTIKVSLYDSYLWNTGETTDSIFVSESSLYSVTATKYNCNVVGSIFVEIPSVQLIPAPQEWSIFSTYLTPNNSNIELIFQQNLSNLSLVKDGFGNIYWPQYGVNNIGNVISGYGYQMKMFNNDTIIIFGDSIVPESISIPFPINWSLIGFPYPQQRPLTQVMNSILQFIILMKDGNGNIYWPQFGVNNIGNMRPSKGYQIKLIEPITFNFPQ